MATRYKDYRPSAFDARGLGCEDKQDWFVAPCSRTRDSNIRENSNFEACLKSLGGEDETVEVASFGHWACGWFEIILVHPSRLDEVERIEGALAHYPVLDDHDLAMREADTIDEAWDLYGLGELVDVMQKEFELADNTCDFLKEHGSETLRAVQREMTRGEEVHDDDSVRFDFSWVRTQTRSELAFALYALRLFVREKRKQEQAPAA